MAFFYLVFLRSFMNSRKLQRLKERQSIGLRVPAPQGFKGSGSRSPRAHQVRRFAGLRVQAPKIPDSRAKAARVLQNRPGRRYPGSRR